jgi:GGDEF domain-containing protein
MDTDNFSTNFIAVSVLFVVIILTYFTSMVAGLVIDVVILFAYLSVTIYTSLTKGFTVETYVYFWCAMLPLTTVAAGIFAKRVNSLEDETMRQQVQLEELVTVDELTGLKNQKAFLGDAEVYIHLAARYKYELIYMVAGFKYMREIKTFVGGKNMDVFCRKVSESMVQKLRKEDQVYMIDRENNIWGLLLINNNPDSAGMIIDRMKEKIKEIDPSRIAKMQNLDVEMRFGAAVYAPETTPIELLSKARKEMEFDV